MAVPDIPPAHAGPRRRSPRAPVAERWLRSANGGAREGVSLLDVDAQLGRRVPAAQHEAARRALAVAIERVPRGSWTARAEPAGQPLGYVVLSGSLIRGLRVGSRWSTEILGPEDVLRPWDETDQPGGFPVEDAWTALEPVKLAVLDRRFATAAARWPGLLDELLARVLRRSRHLAMLLSVSSIRRLDARLLVLMHLLADRWGYVTPDGVHLPLRLTHETLARLAGAQRPSVSTALARLTREGRLGRSGREFVLELELPESIEDELTRRQAG